MWVCPLCQSKDRQVVCCSQGSVIRGNEKGSYYKIKIELNRTTCEHSLHRTASLTDHLKHMETKHGWKIPKEK